MQLSRAAYYSDFIVYPLTIAALTVLAACYPDHSERSEWLWAAGAGVLLWTLLEYVLHRIALHRMAYFSPMHAEHHGDPLELIGTPPWISVSVWCGTILLPVWYFVDFGCADGLTVGIMAGYWWYGVVHHVIHHPGERGSLRYFRELRIWHMRHHYSPRRGNFGVTTSVWDRLFRTAIPPPRNPI